MDNYKLHASSGKGLLVSKINGNVRNRNSSLPKKHVRFSETVSIHWPKDSEQFRLINSQATLNRMERDRKIVALLKREPEVDKGNSEKDPEHPNFPFPMEYKRIDFDHLDPYKLYRAAEYLRQEKERFEEPFRTHAKNIKEFEAKADEVCERELKKFEALPRNPSHPKSRTLPSLGETSNPFNVKKIELKSTEPSDGNSTIMAKMNTPGGQKKAVPGYYPKPRQTKIPRQPRPDSLAMRNVALWVSSNFLFKHVPLILHPPPPGGGTNVLAPQPPMTTNALQTTSKYSNSPRTPSTPLKELHILDGLIAPSNVFNVTVGNDFDKNFDKTPYKETLGAWNPYRFRFTVNMRGFDDNEISLFCQRPFIYIIGESPRTEKKLGQKIQETVEIPDNVKLKNLKFFRLKDGRIIIEEAARRKKVSTTTRDERITAAMRTYYPYSL